jgi:hypothetical protein
MASRVDVLAGATNSYLIEGIEQVWLNKITTDAYLTRMQRCSAVNSRSKVPPLPPRTAWWLFASALLINAVIILVPAG